MRHLKWACKKIGFSQRATATPKYASERAHLVIRHHVNNIELFSGTVTFENACNNVTRFGPITLRVTTLKCKIFRPCIYLCVR